jgi:hypothetical protein
MLYSGYGVGTGIAALYVCVSPPTFFFQLKNPLIYFSDFNAPKS